MVTKPRTYLGAYTLKLRRHGTRGAQARIRALRGLAAGPVLCCLLASCVLADDPLSLVAPLDGAVPPPDVQLAVHVSDPQQDPLEVVFYGRAYTAPGEDFVLAILPDTQYYAESHPQVFIDQTQFIVDNRDALNIAGVFHLGDIVDNQAASVQWARADAAISILDTLLDLPYGLCVGNHDQRPSGNPRGTENFNRYFPVSRYEGVAPWYGGHFGDDNDNHYLLFGAGGLDFVALFLDYDPGADPAVMAWADSVLKQYPDRRGIVCTHHLMNPWYLLNTFSGQGRAIYEGLKDNPNLFLMLGGHICETGIRADQHNGNIVTSILADYQCRPSGGAGWMQLLRFSPANNTVSVFTYSPTRGEFLTSAFHEFEFDYDMSDQTPFEELGRVTVPSGSEASLVWSERGPNRAYEWYATVSDGQFLVTGPVCTFTTLGLTASGAN